MESAVLKFDANVTYTRANKTLIYTAHLQGIQVSAKFTDCISVFGCTLLHLQQFSRFDRGLELSQQLPSRQSMTPDPILQLTQVIAMSAVRRAGRERGRERIERE